MPERDDKPNTLQPISELLGDDIQTVIATLRKGAEEERATKRPVNTRPLKPVPSPTKALPAPLQGIIPFWADAQRPAIHYLIRSALFTCSHAKARRMIRSDAIESLGYFRLGYHGEELRQRDLDLLMQILHLKRGSSADTYVQFSARSLIKSLGWTTGARSYHELEQSLRRMQACSVTVATEGKTESVSYSGTIVAEFIQREDGDKARGMWAVRLNPHIAKLLGPGSYTSVEWATRLKLSPLAKGLSAYIQSHRNNYPTSIELLYRLTGVEYTEHRNFRRDLVKALDSLVEHGVLASFQIDASGLVHVERPDTPAPHTLQAP